MDELDVVALLRALQQLERNASVSLMYSGLRLPQFRFLDRLSECGQATVTEMSGHLGVTRATASVMTNELLRMGAIGIIEHPHDRRSFHVRLTELGSNKLNVARRDLGVLQQKVSRAHAAEVVRTVNGFAAALLAKTVRAKP